ncbi:AAA family ATPase [Frankia sp. CNm7]|uniref:AAA family ATPase n=1 Tax=Frankia nepalensis TaxID=1836974 RepID=A0A937RSZ7_9ACTN|nr:AAA family ATPase [Frankia nepalensis]MBL7499297.1 AAA family ATPase [Frankia nepalensis]MBL7512355.1 AAA family ATPase [Frankia nepalensis]MBL7522582.1 AAA family ATPase [Frankia nepalensis]MBL7632213.1 AAA family ATPase [Frankia nepalensis]
MTRSDQPSHHGLVAVEGLRCTGKTTLATVLASQLGATVIPDAADLSSPLPYPPRTLGDVRSGLDHLCQVERQRAEAARRARTGLVLFDRGPLSHIVHQHAVAQFGVPADPGYAAQTFTAAANAGITLSPGRYLYLRLPHAAVAARQRRRGPVHPHLVDPRFLTATDRAFLRYLDALPDDRCLVLDAGLPVGHLASTAAAFLATEPTSPPPGAWTRTLAAPQVVPARSSTSPRAAAAGNVETRL